jgi:hypothetical protein
VAQTVSRWPLTAEAGVQTYANYCGMSGGQNGTGKGFSPSTVVLPCFYHSIDDPRSFIHQPPVLERYKDSPITCQAGTEEKGYSSTHTRPGARSGWVVRATPRTLYPHERDPVPIIQKAGWVSGPGRKGPEDLAPPGFELRTSQSVASRYTD